MRGDDVCTFLKNDHDKIRRLLDEVATNPDPTLRRELLERIRSELEIHRTLADRVFYPALRTVIGDGRGLLISQHAKEEHDHAGRALAVLQETDLGSEDFTGRLEVLQALIAKHADEEEAEVFSEVRRTIDPGEMQEIGERLHRCRLELERLDSKVRFETHPENIP